MVCKACQERRHGDCRGGNWCDCQHMTEPRTVDEEKERPEPPTNWLRQG